MTARSSAKVVLVGTTTASATADVKAAWWTTARLVLVLPLLLALAHPVAAVACLGLLIVADVADGWMARRLHADGPVRRAVDSAVDRVSVHSAFLALVVVKPSVLPFYLPLALRDLIVSIGGVRCIQHRSVFLAGSSRHRLASLSAAALFVAAVLPSGWVLLMICAGAAWAIHYALLGNYMRGYIQVMSDAPHTSLALRKTR